MAETIRGAIPECATAKECLEKVASPFTGSSKTYASSLVSEFINMRYDGSGVRASLHSEDDLHGHQAEQVSGK
jgi:hypothetical protein